MHKPQRFSLIALTVFTLGAASHGWSDDLGDNAAPLQIETWIKGGPVQLAEGAGRNIYVVEFWATWCGPCRISIPHLSELQRKYHDDNVVFIGISDEAAETVEPFVSDMGPKMEYAVAVDTSRKTHTAYMQAYGQNGIPTAFVVDRNGKVAWFGHPMADLDGVLAQVIDGSHDIDATRRLFAIKAEVPRYFRLLMSRDDAEAELLGRRIVEDGRNDSMLMNAFAWGILTDPELPTRDLELAMVAAQAAYDGSNGQDASIMDTYARAYYESGDLARAVALQQKAVSLATRDRMREELAGTLERYMRESGQ